MKLLNEPQKEMQILKYPLIIAASQDLILPQGAEILSIQNKDGVPTIWALVDPEAKKVTEKIIMLGTGWPACDTPKKFIGTVQVNRYVWHYFKQV